MIRQKAEFYAVVSDWNGIVTSSRGVDKKSSIAAFLRLTGSQKKWRDFEKEGFRCSKVTAAEVSRKRK